MLKSHRRYPPLRDTLVDMVIGFAGGAFVAVVLWAMTLLYWLPL